MTLKTIIKNPRLSITVTILFLIIAVSIFAPILAPKDPLIMNTQVILRPPSIENPLGTDPFGRDILSRLLYGARPSLITAFLATALAAVIGVFLGVIAGHAKGWAEVIIMRSVDVVMIFPPILLAMVVVGFLGGGVRNLILVIGILYAPSFTRLTYASTLQVGGMEYMNAAEVVGVPVQRLIRYYILPNILSPIIVQASLTLAAAILLESGLSFLGLGVIPPAPSWGLMIGDARGYMFKSPLYIVWPSLFIAGTILNFNILGDSLRDILDPRLR